jgi:hypothetical protein
MEPHHRDEPAADPAGEGLGFRRGRCGKELTSPPPSPAAQSSSGLSFAGLGLGGLASKKGRRHRGWKVGGAGRRVCWAPGGRGCGDVARKEVELPNKSAGGDLCSKREGESVGRWGQTAPEARTTSKGLGHRFETHPTDLVSSPP